MVVALPEGVRELLEAMSGGSGGGGGGGGGYKWVMMIL